MSTKKKPTHASAVASIPLIIEQRVNSREKWEDAMRVQNLLPWLALDNFKNGIAKDYDWMMLQYWLYYAELLISVYISEDKNDRLLMGVYVGDAIKALYAIGRRYNDSGYKVMTASQEEINEIAVALMNNDAIKEITDEKLMLAIGSQVQKILKVK